MSIKDKIYQEWLEALNEHGIENATKIAENLADDFPLSNLDKSEIIFIAKLKATALDNTKPDYNEIVDVIRFFLDLTFQPINSMLYSSN